jgi:hypothetical protein
MLLSIFALNCAAGSLLSSKIERTAKIPTVVES